jgi:hypothetical protein
MNHPSIERHANTDRYVAILREAEHPERDFAGIVRALVDPRTDIDDRNPIADLVDALDITRGVVL